MRVLSFCFFLLCLVQFSLAGPEKRESLNEIIDATLATEFDKVFTGEGKTASALDMLKYSIEETTIDPDYLTQVFYDSLGETSDEGIAKHVFKLEKAVDMMNMIIKHFQEAPPNAGRPAQKKEEKINTKEEL